MADHDTTTVSSRRTVLRTTGGLLAGATVLAGLGAGPGVAAVEESIEAEVREVTEEYTAVDVLFPDSLFDETEFPQDAFLGLADAFVVHEVEEAVSLPEDTGGLANPLEVERVDERVHRMYFRTEDVDWPDEERVTVGLGIFPERTVPDYQWATCPGHRDY